jgi:hypothetical protein
MAIEVPCLHLLLGRWSSHAAWAFSVVGAYGFVWLIGDYQAIRFRPLIVGTDCLHIRLGLRWSLDIPYALIARVRPRGLEEFDRRKVGHLRAALLGDTQWIMELRQPVAAKGFYGITRGITHVGLSVDEGDKLLAALQEHGVAT